MKTQYNLTHHIVNLQNLYIFSQGSSMYLVYTYSNVFSIYQFLCQEIHEMESSQPAVMIHSVGAK